jgi:hypothetical protein
VRHAEEGREVSEPQGHPQRAERLGEPQDVPRPVEGVRSLRLPRDRAEHREVRFEQRRGEGLLLLVGESIGGAERH